MTQSVAITRFNGHEALALRTSDGSSATVLLHGAHALSWVPAGQGEQFYLSPSSSYAAGAPIRGGVPVIFPQFSGQGPLQRHGFARNMVWELVQTEAGADGAQAVLRLRDDAHSHAMWPHRFELEMRVRISARSLEFGLSCLNPGQAAFSFACALHTYLRLDNLADAAVHGLGGLRYHDAVAGADKTQQESVLSPAGDLDRIYYGVHQPLRLSEQRGAHLRQIQIDQQGFADAVVWNPGAAKCAALTDMPPEGYRRMLCIEAGCIEKPVLLSPGGRWSGAQTLTLL